MKRASVIKHSSMALLIALLATAAPAAFGVNKYLRIALPDDGFGSTTRGLTKVGAGTLGIVGSKNLADGSTEAMYWRLDPDAAAPNGFRITATGFGGCPAGASCAATGIAFADNDPDQAIIVGYLGTTMVNQGTQAVIWRRNVTGQFASTYLDDAAVMSRANGVALINSPLGLIIVVCGRFQTMSGDWHACLWRVGPAGIERTDLGRAGANSEANAVIYVGTGFGDNSLIVAGNAENGNGRKLAGSWVVRLTGGTGLDWFFKLLPTPTGAESNAAYVSSANGGVWKTTGNITQSNGRTSACFWSNQGDSAANFISALYRDLFGGPGRSMANGLFGDASGDGSRDASDLAVVGTASNSQMRLAVGAFPFNEQFDGPFPLDALRTETVGNNETITVSANATEPQGAIAGQALINSSPTPQAIVLVPAATEVPQRVASLAGTIDWGDGGASQIVIGPNITDLWQRDGDVANIRPRRQGKMDHALIEFLSSSEFNRAPQKLTLVSRILPRNPNAVSPLMLTLQLFDPNSGQWVAVDSQSLLATTYGRGNFFLVDVTIPNSSTYAVMSAKPLRWRLSLSGDQWREWDIDAVEMQTTPNP